MIDTLTHEFNKLDAIDLKVAYWLNSECHSELYNFLSYIAGHNYQRKGIKLNASKVYQELAETGKNFVYVENRYIA